MLLMPCLYFWADLSGVAAHGKAHSDVAVINLTAYSHLYHYATRVNG